MEYVRGYKLINQFCCNPAVLKKKKIKPLKIFFFWTQFAQKGVVMGHAQDGKKIWGAKNNKSRSPAFRKFLFYQNIICFDWVKNLFLSLSDAFCQESVISSAHSTQKWTTPNANSLTQWSSTHFSLFFYWTNLPHLVGWVCSDFQQQFAHQAGKAPYDNSAIPSGWKLQE